MKNISCRNQQSKPYFSAIYYFNFLKNTYSKKHKFKLKSIPFKNIKKLPKPFKQKITQFISDLLTPIFTK